MRICGIVAVMLLFIGGSEVMGEARYVEQAFRVCDPVVQRLEKRHNMHTCGQGGAFYQQVTEVRYVFQLARPLSKDEAREIAIDAVESLLREINSSERIRPYLKRFPMQAENVEVDLLIVDSSLRQVCAPSPSSVMAMSGTVYYNYKESEGEKGFSWTEKEPYQVALGMVRGDD